jgi:hypothetical protein
VLIYHPMFDPYHCALRFSCILTDSQKPNMEWDRLRLLDFFVTFPHLLSRIRLPRALTSRRGQLRDVPEPYERLPASHRLFFQLNEIQVPAARVLGAKNIFNQEALKNGSVVVTNPAELAIQVNSIKAPLAFRSAACYPFVIKELAELTLNGRDGLKDRSGVMEFRHDAI